MTEDVNQPSEETPEAVETETGATVQPVEEAATETPAPETVAEEEPSVADEAAAAEPEPAAEDEPSVADEAAAEPEPAADAPQEVRRTKKRLPRAQRPPRSKPKREQPSERKPIVRLPKPEHERGRRQERRGVVVSSAMDKTIVVKVESVKAHPRYKKVVRRATKFHAHDEGNAAKVGDVVRIVESRPLSKTKHWRLAEIVEAAR